MASKKRRSYTIELKRKAIEFSEARGNRSAGREFNVDESMVRRWRKEKAILAKLPGQKKGRRGGKPRCFKLEKEIKEEVVLDVSMEWTGFTDSQIKLLKNTADQDSGTTYHQDGKRMEDGHAQQSRPLNTRTPPQRGRGRGPSVRNRPDASSDQASINHRQMLSKPKQVQQHEKSHQKPEKQTLTNQTQMQRRGQANQKSDKTKAPVSSGGAASSRSETETPVDNQSINRIQSANNVGEPGKKDEATAKVNVQVSNKNKETLLGKELDEKEGLNRELSKMEHFQQQQKEIEDGNLRKKNMLARAIADRKKKTQAETKRLGYIQKELSQIEEFLTGDVNILRDKIEEASRHYMEARKRYQKAEAEFVTAKISLHKASDHKEALTEHLCYIIRENELRKAKKLEELVEKLDVDNLEAFEAEMEAEKAAKAQSRLSSSSVGGTSEDAKSTLSPSSAGDALLIVDNVPSEQTIASRGEDVKVSSGTAQSQNSSTSPTAGDVTQTGATLPNSTSQDTSETLSIDASETRKHNGKTDSNENIEKPPAVAEAGENTSTLGLESGHT